MNLTASCVNNVFKIIMNLQLPVMIGRFMIASNKNSQIRCFLSSRIIFMECPNRQILLRAFHGVHIRFISDSLKIPATNKGINLYALLFFYLFHCTVNFFKTAMEAALKCDLFKFILRFKKHKNNIKRSKK